jgi:hypothetical protein
MSRFACTPLAPLPRRTFLAALGAAALAPLAARAADEPRVSDLVDATGQATEAARALAGRTITLRGYLDLAADVRSLALTETPSGPCGLCGLSHNAGPALLVDVAGPVPAFAAQQIVAVSGRLDVANDGAVRLTNAAVAA